MFWLHFQFFPLLSDHSICHLSEYILSLEIKDTFYDINSGSVYKDYDKEHVTDRINQLVCHILMYLDATLITQNGRMSLKPVSFTLGIFPRHVKKNLKAWRNLGYLCDVEVSSTYDNPNHTPTNPKLKTANKSLRKLRDMHIVYHKLLKGFRESQNGAPIIIPIEINGKIVIKEVIIPLLIVIGDTEEHD